MCRTLFHIPHEVFGFPLFGMPSWSVVAWLVFCAIALAGVVRHRTWERLTGNLTSMVVVTAVLGFVLPRMEETVADEVWGIAIRGYGVMMLIAVVTGIATALYRARQIRLDQEVLLTMAMWMFVSGILGARLFFVVQKWDQFAGGSLWDMLIGIVNLAEGGLVVYGAFLGAMAGLTICLYRLRLPFLPLCDMIAASMLFGLAIGRIGCLMNGCCYGGVSDHIWAVRFPQESPPYVEQLQQGMMHGFSWTVNARDEVEVTAVTPASAADRGGLRKGDIIVAVDGQRLPVPTTKTGSPTKADPSDQNHFVMRAMELQLLNAGAVIQLALGRGTTVAWEVTPWPARSFPVQPTQIYSAINALLLGLLLWYVYPVRRRDGQVFALLLVLYPVTRFLLEIIRIDEGSFAGTGLSISQNISLVVGVIGLLLGGYIQFGSPHRLWRPTPVAAA